MNEKSEFTSSKPDPLEPHVSHPAHYTWIPGVECIQVSRHFGFLLGNVIKYIWRAGFKASTSRLEDLLKARQYLSWEIEAERNNSLESSR